MGHLDISAVIPGRRRSVWISWISSQVGLRSNQDSLLIARLYANVVLPVMFQIGWTLPDNLSPHSFGTSKSDFKIPRQLHVGV